MKEIISKWIWSNRNYRHHDSNGLIVKKVFNHGMGALDLLRFYPEEKTIVINRVLFKPCDERKLREFCRDCGMESWRWLYDSLGYPDWYRRGLSLHYALEILRIRQLKERFVEFYSQFDKRLRKIGREKIRVVRNGDHYNLSCMYYGKKYGQYYPV